MYYGFSDEYPHNFYTDLMDGKLHRWCDDGILMLNTSLTVKKNVAGSHTKYWKDFTGLLFRELDRINRPVLFVAWGQHAKEYLTLVQSPKHQKIIASHPASAIYKGTKWDSEDSFGGIESFIKEFYDKKFKWEKSTIEHFKK
jgi:uracil-DNA glycosylase